MSLRHVARAVGANGQDMMVRKAAGDEHQSATLAIHRRSNKLVGWAIDYPMAPSRIWIIAGDAFVPRQNHLRSASDVADERRAIAACVILAWRLPEYASVGSTKRK